MDLLCFSHLRWNFVYQRPQHLLSRFANYYRVFYIEEYEYTNEEDGYYLNVTKENVWIVTPHLKEQEESDMNEIGRLKKILNKLFYENNINCYICWYYTPMPLCYTDHLMPELIVYDCMDELSAFKFAPAIIKNLEKELFKKADVVFTGGYTLYLAKKQEHHNIHCFPSSIDKEHFLKARYPVEDPADHGSIPHPRLGFFGVIDERFDIELITKVAIQKPEWNFVFLGPVVKIDPDSLPRLKNIHYLGSKKYEELPSYLAGWDIALIPFALNESTQFISPTKTPEYLAAGIPVISTAIKDVVRPYGENALVHIVYSANDFIEKATIELAKDQRDKWLKTVDAFLANNSWNNTWHEMNSIINNQLEETQDLKFIKKEMYV